MSNRPVSPEAQPSPLATDEVALALEQKRLRDRRAELMFGPTGAFRHIIERYLEQVAPAFYKVPTLRHVRGDLARFFRFVVLNEGIEDLEQIRPSTVTRFIEAERERGIRGHLFLGELARFFDWLISEDFYDRGNPVVSSMHRRQMMAPPASSL